jgi:hypothetical protein
METIDCGMRIELTSYQKDVRQLMESGRRFRMTVEIIEEKLDVENLDVYFLMQCPLRQLQIYFISSGEV